MKKKTHEQYVIEVAEINPNIEVVGKYIDTHTPILHKCRVDGYEWMASPGNILRGRGCPKCKALKLHNLKAKQNDQYVSEVAKINPNIVVLGQYAGNKTPVLHMCLLDNYVWYASPDNILHGSGCPKCKAIKISICKTKTHEQYVKEVFEINPYIEVVDIYVNAETKILHRCLIDGCEWDSLPGNILSGHGCPFCNQSIGERQISIYLNKNGFAYIPQHIFNTCKYKKCLPFDFYLPDYNICIEYDGEQHFRPIEYFGGENGFIERKRNDAIKNAYCDKNDIALLRIAYNQDIEIELDNFFNNTKLIKEVS